MPRRREMELHGGVTLQPAAILGLVGIEVVEDDVDGGVRVSSDDAVHELEKLNAPPPATLSAEVQQRTVQHLHLAAASGAWLLNRLSVGGQPAGWASLPAAPCMTAAATTHRRSRVT
jgi:hypothetical protein